MSKNSGIFHRLPNGYYGLVKWYPELKRAKRPAAAQERNGEEEATDEASENADSGSVQEGGENSEKTPPRGGNP